ncbi:MAG: DUF4168 domain-containing protein [Candidatus Brocadiaceae bacterium]|nr:DUF4168 domain-containing protein [Candidatus Brocadiaceae bacterium]
MKKYIIPSLILVVAIIVVIALVKKPESPSTSKKSGSDGQVYWNEEAPQEEAEDREEISLQKLTSFASAFVRVQAYLEIVGKSARYEETTSIVKKYGLSVEEYTKIATRMSENPAFRDKVQTLIKHVDLR